MKISAQLQWITIMDAAAN